MHEIVDFFIDVRRRLCYNEYTGLGPVSPFNDGFRLDYTNYLQAGDIFLLEKIAFCIDRALLLPTRVNPIPSLYAYRSIVTEDNNIYDNDITRTNFTEVSHHEFIQDPSIPHEYRRGR